MSPSPDTASWVKVWDPYVRFFHWALVACFIVAYFTGEDAGENGNLHIWAGYAICGLLATRLAWGFIGSPHARFRDFTFSPATTVRYLKDMISGHPKRYLGHSPAGAAMTFALIVCLTGTAWTGLQAYAEEGKGPLAGNGAIITQALADEHERRGGDGQGTFETEGAREDEDANAELHEFFANLTIGLIVLHLCGIGFSSMAHRENLVAAMITGRKRPEDAS